MKKSILMLMIFCLVISLTACSTESSIDYNIDGEIEKIINLEPYNEDLLNTELQNQLKEDSMNEELSLIDVSLVGYEGAENKLPFDDMFDKDISHYAIDSFDWMGEKWSVNAYENKQTTKITAIRLLLGFDVDNMDYARTKIKELSNNFLKKYNKVLHTSNLYEYKLEETYRAPLDIIVSIDEAFITYRVYMYELESGETFPCIQIFFVEKEPLHDISDNDLKYEIERIRNLVSKEDEEVLLRTIKLNPSMGYIIDEPKPEENRTPEEELISGGVFYN